MRRWVSSVNCKLINIAALQFSLEYHALEVYVAGCKEPHCPGCHNSALWNFAAGSPVADWEPRIRSFASDYGGDIPLIQNVWVLGGEPLDQDTDALEHLLSTLNAMLPRTRLWLWTRYEIEAVPAQILRLCDYIKTGQYISAWPGHDVRIGGYKISLGSGNQRIYRIINGVVEYEG